MLELLDKFTPVEIIIFIVLLAIAFKKIADFLDWMADKIKKRDLFKKGEYTEEQKISLRNKQIDETLEVFSDVLEKLTKKVDVLMNSDKDAIKAFITREHHYFCYQKKWIDDYSLDCIERRYEHYKKENGNSFISGLMDELRALPKQPPDKEGE